MLLVALDAAYRIGLTASAGRTLGQLAVRIRVVQHGSGAVPTWRQTILRWAVVAPATFGPGLVAMPRSARRWTDRMEQVRPRIEELRRRYGQDRHRLDEELLALFQREQLDPAAGCLADLPRAVGSLVYQCAVYLPVLRRPLHQGLHDHVAGTVVVQETRPTAPHQQTR